MKKLVSSTLIITALLVLTSCGQKWTATDSDGFILIQNPGGQNLGYSPESGVSILSVNRYAFKDLNQNGRLDPYEDWRLSSEERAANLATQMTVEQIAGLMLYSGHQSIPGGGRGRITYQGKAYEESGAHPWDLNDQQLKFLSDDNLRHVLITRVQDPETAARWNNQAQALVEGLGLGIPANNSSDPRHRGAANEEYTLGAGGDISRWPGGIGLAATFDPELVKHFGKIASIEYRALGIATALSPQIDLATDPRWSRFNGTFGSSPELATDMARAYVDGFQSSSPDQTIEGGWGYESVNAMSKHWPGGGSGEGGRDAHYGYGKYAVFPGQTLETHMKPFVEGAFALEGGTEYTSAIMPYYTISFNQDPGGENVGNAYSKYFITDQLREKYGYDGVVCTDWGITNDEGPMAAFAGKSWGMEEATVAERHYKVLMAGCDQFGGNNDAGPVLEAYQLGVEEHGEEFMRKRFEESAVRLLKNIFRVGLFENPYLDPAETIQTVGKADYMESGYKAQLKSAVLLKNRGEVLPLNKELKLYVPQRYYPSSRGYFGPPSIAEWKDPMSKELLSSHFRLTEKPEDADVALVVIHSPQNGRNAGYSEADAQKGGNGFMPISLQYRSYTATDAREVSLAGDSRESDVMNRSYQGKTVDVLNKADLDLVLETRKAMGNKPVVVILKMSNPTVVAEFEKEIDALIVDFEVQDQAILEILAGQHEPSGLLPLQIPASMSAVEKQLEDAPLDMEVHVDSEGHAYDFAFGLNWTGIIQDERTRKYGKN